MPKRLSSNISAAAVAGLVSASLLVACGGSDEPKLTFQGLEVKDQAKSLTAFEKNWRAHFATSDAKVRIADDAKCFYQVLDKEVTPKLLCGPFREAGSESTGWSTAGISGYPAQNGKGITLTFEDGETVDWDDASKPLPNAVAMTAAGEKANVAESVDEPDAPEVASGKAVLESGADGGSGGMDGTLLYATDDGLWSVSNRTPKPSRYAGSGAARHQAPKGSVLLEVSVSHEASDVSQNNSGNLTAAAQATEKETSLSVTAGGKTVALPKPDASGTMSGTWLVAVPGDGKDATLNVSADGGTQTVNLRSKEIGGVTAGWTADASGNSVSTQPLTQQYGCDTNSFGVDYANLPKKAFNKAGIDCSVKWKIAPYVRGKGWAPKGSQWWQVFIAPKVTDLQWWDADGISTSYKANVTLASATLGGDTQDKPETVTLTPPGFGQAATYEVFTFAVKNGTYPTAVTLKGKGEGTLDTSFPSSGAPKTWTDDSVPGTIRTQ